MCRAGSASPACLRITIFDKSSKSTGFVWINKERASRAHGPRRERTQSEEPSPFMSLHCIWSIQPSSIGAVPMIRFSAWHDKCLPASAFVAMKDKTLVVVFPSAEVCNNIMITFTGVDSAAPPAPFCSLHLFSFSSHRRDRLSTFCVVSMTFKPPYIKSVSITRSGGSALTIAEILDQSLVILLEGSTYFLRMKK